MENRIVVTHEPFEGGVAVAEGDVLEARIAGFLTGPEEQRQVHHAIDDGDAGVVGIRFIHASPGTEVTAFGNEAVGKNVRCFEAQSPLAPITGQLV